MAANRTGRILLTNWPRSACFCMRRNLFFVYPKCMYHLSLFISLYFVLLCCGLFSIFKHVPLLQQDSKCTEQKKRGNKSTSSFFPLPFFLLLFKFVTITNNNFFSLKLFLFRFFFPFSSFILDFYLW